MASKSIERAYSLLILCIIMLSPLSAATETESTNNNPCKGIKDLQAICSSDERNIIECQDEMVKSERTCEETESCWDGKCELKKVLAPQPAQQVFDTLSQARQTYSGSVASSGELETGRCPKRGEYGKGKVGVTAVPKVFFSYDSDEIGSDHCSSEKPLFCNGAQALIEIENYIVDKSSKSFEAKGDEFEDGSDRHETCYGEDNYIEIFKTKLMYLTKESYGPDLISSYVETFEGSFEEIKELYIVDGDGDLDGDGLNNKEELTFGTDPLKKDTDGDGLCDSAEDFERKIEGEKGKVKGILNKGDSCPLDKDSDEDGLPDGKEIKHDKDTDGDGRKNVLDCDSDQDNLPDGLERGKKEKVKEGEKGGFLNSLKTEFAGHITDYKGPFKIKGTKEEATFEQEGPLPFGDGEDLECFIMDEDPDSKTDMTERDTDGDHLTDGMEDYCGEKGEKPNGRKDPEEGCTGDNIETDPLSDDTDTDGEKDGKELNIRFTPKTKDWEYEGGDYCKEFEQGNRKGQTDPNDWDSDDDGLPDKDCGWVGRLASDCETAARKAVKGDYISARDQDSDDDKLCDGLEKGLSEDNFNKIKEERGECFKPEGKYYEVKGFGNEKKECFIGCGKKKLYDADPDTITDPFRDDTDGDGIKDNDEDMGPGDKKCNGKFDNKVIDSGGCPDDYETDPNHCDTDGDGLNDKKEKDEGICPLSKDTDDGGIDDYREVSCTFKEVPLPGCDKCIGKCGMDPKGKKDDLCALKGCCKQGLLCAIKKAFTVAAKQLGAFTGAWCGGGEKAYHETWDAIEEAGEAAGEATKKIGDIKLPESCPEEVEPHGEKDLLKKEVEPGKYKVTPVIYHVNGKKILFIAIEKDTPLRNLGNVALKNSPFYYLPFDSPLLEDEGAEEFGAGASSYSPKSKGDGEVKAEVALYKNDEEIYIEKGGKTKIKVIGPPAETNKFYEKVQDGIVLSVGKSDEGYEIEFTPSYAYPIIVSHSNKATEKKKEERYAYEFHSFNIDGKNVSSLKKTLNWKPLCSNIEGVFGGEKNFEGKKFESGPDTELSKLCANTECRRTLDKKCIEGGSSDRYGFYYGKWREPQGKGGYAKEGVLAYEALLFLPQKEGANGTDIKAEFELKCANDSASVYSRKELLDKDRKKVTIDSSKEGAKEQVMQSIQDVFKQVEDGRLCVYTAGSGENSQTIFAWNPEQAASGLEGMRDSARTEVGCTQQGIENSSAGALGTMAAFGSLATMMQLFNQQSQEDEQAAAGQLSQAAQEEIDAQSACENQIAGEPISGESRDTLAFLHGKVKASISKCEEQEVTVEGDSSQSATLRKLYSLREEIETEYIRTYDGEDFDNCLNPVVRGKLRDNIPAMKEGRISEKCKVEYFGEKSAYTCFFNCETPEAFPETDCTYKCEDFSERICEIPKTCEKSCLMLGGECVEDKYKTWDDVKDLSIGRVKEIEKARVENCIDIEGKSECRSQMYCYYSETLASKDCEKHGLENECPRANCKWNEADEACIGRNDGCRPCYQAICSRGNGATPGSCQSIGNCPSMRLENISCNYVQPAVNAIQQNPLKAVLYGVEETQAATVRQPGQCLTPSEAQELAPPRMEEPGKGVPSTASPLKPPVMPSMEVRHSIIDPNRPVIELKMGYLEHREAEILRYKVKRTVLVEGEPLPGEEGIASELFKKTEGNYVEESGEGFLLWIDSRQVPASRPYTLRYLVEAFAEGSLIAENTIDVEVS